MNKNIWHILLITIVCASCSTRTADTEFPVASSITSITKETELSDVPEKFQFSDKVIIEFFDQWNKEDITQHSSTPLQVALNCDFLAICRYWARVNEITLDNQPQLYRQVYQSLKFPLAQRKRILKHLVTTNPASVNEVLKKNRTPLHPDFIALLGAYPNAHNQAKKHASLYNTDEWYS